MSKVCSITGAGRGMGVNIAKSAPAAGNTVITTGRNINLEIQLTKNWR